MKLIPFFSFLLIFTFSMALARVPNIVEHKLLSIDWDIETELSRIGFTIAGTHPSKLSSRFTEQKFVRDCWILDDNGNVVLILYFFINKFRNDPFIKNETIRLNKSFKIEDIEYRFGIISSDQQLIKAVVNVVSTLDVNNKKYDEYPY